MSVLITRKSGGLLLVLVLFILQISMVYGHVGTTCNAKCESATYSSCGISKGTTTSWDAFGGGGNGNCIYKYGSSVSCTFGACAPTCLDSTFTVVNCSVQGAISFTPATTFMNPNAYTGRSRIDGELNACSASLTSNFNKLPIGVPYGAYYSYKIDGTSGTSQLLTASGSIPSGPSYSIDTSTIVMSGKRILTDLKLNSIDFTFGTPCTLNSYFPGTESYTKSSFDCLYGPSREAGCCGYSAPDFKLNTNYIVNATTGVEAGRWYFCADTTLDTQSITGFAPTTYWRYSANSRYKFDRIDFKKSAMTVPATFRGTNATFYDILATDYVGTKPYGWLICKTDGFYTSSGTKLNPSSNILKSISASLPQVTVDQFMGGGNGALVSTPGSTTMSLKDFLKMLGGVTIKNDKDDSVAPQTYYASTSYVTDPTYFSDTAYSNEKTIDKLPGAIVIDPTDMKLRKDANNKIINSEPLLYGRKFPMDKMYYDISIKDTVTGITYDSREHITFRKDSAGTRLNINELTDGAFTVQSDNIATTNIDESGYLKPVYLHLDDFNNDDNKGKSYDVILHFCSTKSSIVSGAYDSDCTTYTFKNLLRLGFVVDDKSTLASSAFLCKDNKIYECCGRNFYCMNKDFLGSSMTENLAKTFADGEAKFKDLRRSSQFIDVLYDPDFEVVNVSQRDNEVKVFIGVNTRDFAISDTNMLFKKELDPNKFTNLEFDFFTYFPLSGKVKVCLKSGGVCCQNVTQRITQRVFEHISLPISGFDCYVDATTKISIDSLQVYASKSTSSNFIKNCVINPPSNECDNLFVLDRFYLSKSTDPSYFCGSNRTWIKDFDLDPIACDDTPGMYWAGGPQGSAGANGLVANNKNCCGDDPGETWENPNGNGACVNGRYIFNNQRYMDSYRLTEAEVTPEKKNIDYAQIISYDGKLYGCNLDGITVGMKTFTVATGDKVNASLDPTANSLVTSSTQLSSKPVSGNGIVSFKGVDFRLSTPAMINGVKECSIKGSFYCSPRDGWRRDSAKDGVSVAVTGNERIGYSDIATDVSGATKDNIYLLDASENQLKNLSARTGELDGCCPVGWCWNGLSCTQNQRNRPSDWLRLVKDDGDKTITDSDSFYRCIDGKWTTTPPMKKTWQSKESMLIPNENTREMIYSLGKDPSGISGSTNGFCPRKSDCLVSPSVSSNRYNRSFDYLGNNRCDVFKSAENVLCVVTTATGVKTTGYLNKGNCTISDGLRTPLGSYTTGKCTVTKTVGDGSKVTGIIGISSQSARGQDFLNDYLKTVMTEQGTRLYEDLELYKFPNIQDVQCIPNGYYIGDYFCGNDSTGAGKWTSRTEMMFEKLSSFTTRNGLDLDKYTIHCGNLEEVFNTKPEFSSPAEYNNKGCLLRGNCTGGYCPANHAGNAGFSILALELNTKNSNIITSMKSSRDLKRPFSQSLYDQMGTNEGMFTHYADANIILVSKDIAIPTLGSQTLFDFFQRILGFFTKLVPANEFKPSTYLQGYYIVDKMYFAKSGNQVIFASSGYTSDSEIITKVVYSGFSTEEITNIKNQFEKFRSYELSRESNWVGAVSYLNDPKVSANGKELLIEFSLPNAYTLSTSFYEDLSKSNNEYSTNMFWDRLIDDFVVQTRLN